MNIFQIYYKPEQISYLEPEFIPYDNSKGSNLWCEYEVFLKEAKKHIGPKKTLTGFLSWKFKRKSFVSGKEFTNFIEGQPGQDVYLVNPYPHIFEGMVRKEPLFANVWLQGDFAHPGLLKLGQRLFDALGYKVNLDELQHNQFNGVYCNYFVATPEFWSLYLDFTRPFYELLQSKEFVECRSLSCTKRGLTYVPFIMERLLSTLLVLNKDIKFASYEYSFMKRLHMYLDRQVRGEI